jgi:4-amino-4-deoxy-L-arabinose transferase-like glycosyltransferase
LIFGHNGVSRLESNGRGGNTPPSGTQPNQPSNDGTTPQQGQTQGPPPAALEACADQTQGDSCSFTTRNGNTIEGSCITPPNQTALACAPQGMIPQNGQAPNGQVPAGGPNRQNGGTPFSNETGSPSVLRFFTSPLSKQMSWLLPFALISILLAIFGSKIQIPIESGVHKALILWGGWLLTCVVFFSMVSGIFHAYYAIMLAPALGGMVGIGFGQLYKWGKVNTWVVVGLIVAVVLTLGFQIFATTQYNEFAPWMLGTGILLGLGILLMSVSRRAAYAVILSAALVIPTYWSVMTVTNGSNNNLPTAYEGGQNRNGQDGFLASPPQNQNDGDRGGDRSVNTELLAYLEANTQGMKYLMAVPSSQQGAQYVIETGRGVLYMGGFSGGDEVVTVDDLKELIANGDLRYILYGGNRGNQEIVNWLSSSCALVNEFNTQTQGQGPQDQGMTLYSCR